MSFDREVRDFRRIGLPLLVVGLVLVAPYLAAEALGSLEEERTFVGDRESADADRSATPYHSLTEAERETFDAALGSEDGAVGTIDDVEYVRYDGGDYPVETRTVSRLGLEILLWVGLALGALAIGAGVLVTITSLVVPGYGLVVEAVGPIPLAAFWIAATAVVVAVVAVPFGHEAVFVSTDPVEEPDLEGDVVALEDLPEWEHEGLRTATEAEADAANVGPANRLPDVLSTAAYVEVDGEYHALEVRDGVNAGRSMLLTGVGALLFVAMMVGLTFDLDRDGLTTVRT